MGKKMHSPKRQCAVLLATFNGARFLEEQIESLKMQVGVDSVIYYSDDCSNDRSIEICKNNGLVNLNPKSLKFGSSAANFLHLIENLQLRQEVEYVFLSDQDDVWRNNKMIISIETLELNGADAYSGSFETCNAEGEVTGYVNKSFKQTDIDYFFRSPGPGFTFCLKRECFETIRENIRKLKHQKEIRWHDWFIYAQARILGLKWVIDEQPLAYYRLHQTNDTGQLSSLTQLWSRFNFLMNGSYRKQIILLSDGSSHPIRKRVIRLNFIDRLNLLIAVPSMRSKIIDRFALIIWALLSTKKMK